MLLISCSLFSNSLSMKHSIQKFQKLQTFHSRSSKTGQLSNRILWDVKKCFDSKKTHLIKETCDRHILSRTYSVAVFFGKLNCLIDLVQPDSLDSINTTLKAGGVHINCNKHYIIETRFFYCRSLSILILLSTRSLLR